MAFFTSAISTLQTLVTALGAGLGVWGVINLRRATATTTPARMLMYGREAQQKTGTDSRPALFRKARARLSRRNHRNI